MRTRVCAAVALCVLTYAAPAAADFDTQVDESGAPHLHVATAGYDTPDADEIKVYRCPDGGTCEDAPLPLDASAVVTLGTVAPGDVFEARYMKGGTVVRADRTPAWTGTPAVATPPALQGEPVVGARVSATASAWTGGWGAPWGWYAGSEVTVCRSLEGTDCWALSPGSPVALDARWAGWYLFATAQFTSSHYHIPPPVPPPVYPHLTRVASGPVVAVSAPAGPIAAKSGAPAPPTAKATLRSRPLRRNHRLTLGSIECPVRCVAKVTVSGGGKTLHRTLWVTGTKAITIAPRRGRLRVKVVVDGKTLASGISRAR
jgi:hypothetical protein